MYRGDVPEFDKNAPEFFQSARRPARKKEERERLEAAAAEAEKNWIAAHKDLISSLKASDHLRLKFTTVRKSGDAMSGGYWATTLRCAECGRNYAKYAGRGWVFKKLGYLSPDQPCTPPLYQR